MVRTISNISENSFRFYLKLVERVLYYVAHYSCTCVSVSAFIYFGAKVDAGIPFNVHKEHNTGGWVGPFSMILAQNSTLGGNTTVVDRYVARYVQSPTTPFLHMHPNNTLLSANDFEHYLGPSAVNQTVKAQPNVTGDKDPYEQYLKTCDNGDVKPILPLYEFSFVQDKDTGVESIQVKLDYKLLSIPHKKDIMYKVFPWMQSRVNRRHRGFHISGPYCYGKKHFLPPASLFWFGAANRSHVVRLDLLFLLLKFR